MGFPNNSGGYELRNQYFKGSAAPKDVSIISQGASEIKVFEGFFSFLSYLTLMKKDFVKMIPKEPAVQSNFLILNSLSFLEKSRSLLEDHAVIDLYLDRDSAGLEATKKALHWSPRYKDQSHLYKDHKDLNDLLAGSQKLVKREEQKRGRHI